MSMDAQTKYAAATAQRASLEQQAVDLESQAAAAVASLADVDLLASLQSKAAALVQLVARAKMLERQARAELLSVQIADTRRRMDDITATIPEATAKCTAQVETGRALIRAAEAELAAVQNARAALFGEMQAMATELEKLRG